MDNASPARYWHRLDDGRVQCDLCPRHCRLHHDQRGLCFVRGCVDGAMVLTTYGRSSGFCIDPVEKKPLNHFLPGTPILSFGTAGCNLTCKFCQNWDISKAKETDRLNSVASPQMIVAAARQTGCRSIAFTYNDPVIFLEYAVDVARLARQNGIRTVAVTAGYISGPAREEFFSHMDAANVDLKAFSEAFYHDLCGGHLQDILDTLIYLKRHTQVWVELTTLLIPGRNDSDDELNAMCAWIMAELGADVPLHFTAYHPAWRFHDAPPTDAGILGRARTIALSHGLHYVYTGNVHDAQGGTTFCPNCQQPLIIRDWHQITAWSLSATGGCPHCGTAIAGHFEPMAGTWGRKRQPIRFA